MKKTGPLRALLATLALAIPAANASLVLYSSTFSGSTKADLEAVDSESDGIGACMMEFQFPLSFP